MRKNKYKEIDFGAFNEVASKVKKSFLHISKSNMFIIFVMCNILLY